MPHLGHVPSERLRRILGSRGALFAVLFLWPAVLVSPSGPSMTDSVLLATFRLVDEGTLTLSDRSEPELVFLTRAFDISFHDGRVYSGVGPGASILAAPFYALSKPLLGLFDDALVANRRVSNYYVPNSRALGVAPAPHFTEMFVLQILLVWLLVAPLLALLLVRVHRRLVRDGVHRAQSAAVVAAIGLGSMVLYYGTMYSRQAVAYLLVWHALLSLWDRGAPSSRASLLAGAAFGAAVAVDYPSALLVGILLVFTLPPLEGNLRRRVLAPLGCAVALLLAYHWIAFGSPLSTPYQNRFWVESAVAAERGLLAFEAGRRPTANLPSPGVMLQLAFGLYKGLFVYSPILLLGLLGHVAALRDRGRRRGPHAVSLLVFVAYLVFNSTLGTHVAEYGHHFWGGLSNLWGPRHLLGVVPFAAWGLAAVDWSRALVRWTSLAALLVSCVFNVAGVLFSHVLMATFAFSRELRYPLGYALRLLAERGPRVPLLDAYAVDPGTQAALLVGLGVLTAVVLWVSASLTASKS